MLLDGQKANFMRHHGIKYEGVGLEPTSFYVIILLNFKEDKLMDYSIFRFTLNMHTHRSQAMVKVFKGDTAVKLIITITDGGNVYKFGSGCTATLTGKKANGETISHSCIITDNIIIYLFDGETTDCSGIVTCEITLYDSTGGVITAPQFTIDVAEKEVEGSEPISEYSAVAISTVMGAAAGEETRRTNETTRQTNETTRQTNEETRQTSYTEAKRIAENAEVTAKNAEDTVKSVDLSYDNSTGHLIYSYTQDGVKKEKMVNLPLENAVIGIEEDKDANGQPYLILVLANGNRSEPIPLDDIFQGFVKINTGKNVVYAKDAEGNECTIPIDSDRYETGKIVRRKSDDRIAVGPAEDGTDALPLGQAKQMFITRSDSEDMGVDSVFTLDTNGEVQNIPYGKEVVGTYIVARDNYGGILVPENPTESNHSVPKSYVDKAKEEVDSRLDQLESASLKYTEFSGVTDAVQVPVNAAKNVPVYKIGGMTYKSENRLRPIYSSAEHGPLTITVNEDYSITINGDTNDEYYSQQYIPLLDEGGGHNGYLHFGVSMPDGIELYTSHYDEENDFTDEGTTSFEGSSYTHVSDYFSYSLSISSGTYNNFTIYPMLTNSATPPNKYVPYFEGLRDTKVTELRSEGANYFDKSKVTNATETETGFKFTNTVNADNPTNIGYFKDLAPNLKVGDVVTLYANVVNPQKTNYANGYLYMAGVSKSWYGGTFITITEAHLSGKLYAYGKLNEVCEYNDLIITKVENAPYKPYRGTIDTLPISAELRAFLADKGYGKGISGYPNYIDFERKVFVQKVNETDLGELTWRKHSDNHFITTSLPLPSKAYSVMERGVCLCSIYPTATWTEVNTSAIEKGIAIHQSQLFVVDKQINDLDAFVNALKGEKICYELEKPDETNISAYLTDDEIEVEGGGAIVPVNPDYNNPAFVECMFTELK
jgi:hypothetical protein